MMVAVETVAVETEVGWLGDEGGVAELAVVPVSDTVGDVVGETTLIVEPAELVVVAVTEVVTTVVENCAQ